MLGYALFYNPSLEIWVKKLFVVAVVGWIVVEFASGKFKVLAVPVEEFTVVFPKSN